MREAALVVLLSLAILSAGCLAGDDGPSGVDVQSQDPQGNGTGGAGEVNATAEPEPTPSWNVTVVEATVEGVNAGAVSLGEPFGDPQDHYLNVTQGDRNLTLNFTTEGEVWVTIYEPGCEPSPTGSGDCTHRADTGGTFYEVTGQESDGESQFTMEDPPAGTWRVQVYKGDTGVGSTDYTMEIAILEPPAPVP